MVSKFRSVRTDKLELEINEARYYNKASYIHTLPA